MKILKNSLVASGVGLLLYCVVTVLVWHPPAPLMEGAPAQEEILAQAKVAAPSWDFQSQEMDLLIAELRVEKEALAKREKDLNEFAARLQAEQLEINVVTQAVYQLQAQVEAHIVRIGTEEEANIKKLARTYAAMSPEGAAPILKEMEEGTLLKILAVMKETESAPIMEAMAGLGADDAKRVAQLTERLRFYLGQPKPTKRGGV